MSNPDYKPSPDQQRFIEINQGVGLPFEEALCTIGRKAGGLPEYRRLTRLEQLTKIAEFVRRGLTDEEAHRVVGLPYNLRFSRPSKSRVDPKKQGSPDWMQPPGANPFRPATHPRSQSTSMGRATRRASASSARTWRTSSPRARWPSTPSAMGAGCSGSARWASC